MEEKRVWIRNFCVVPYPVHVVSLTLIHTQDHLLIDSNMSLNPSAKVCPNRYKHLGRLDAF